MEIMAIDVSILNLIIGTVYVLFRMWLAEIKLKDELEFRKRYLSRYLSYYAGLVVVFNFENVIFNFITIAASPVVLVSIIGWDSLFFVKFNKRTYWEKNKGWLLVERATMHIPMIIIAIYLLVVHGLPSLTWIEAIRIVVYAFAILYLWFFVVDKRWYERYIWPTGLNIFIFADICIIGTAILCVVL